MTPTLRFAIAAGPIGPVGVCVRGERDDKVLAVLVADTESDLEAALAGRFRTFELVRDQTGLAKTLEELDKIWQDPPLRPLLELDPIGTDFQKSVWDQLRKIPAATTITYGELARRIGKPKSARAVARACGANPLLVLIPCHRVVGADGKLTGFRAGIHRKKWLLERESKIST